MESIIAISQITPPNSRLPSDNKILSTTITITPVESPTIAESLFIWKLLSGEKLKRYGGNDEISHTHRRQSRLPGKNSKEWNMEIDMEVVRTHRRATIRADSLTLKWYQLATSKIIQEWRLQVSMHLRVICGWFYPIPPHSLGYFVDSVCDYHGDEGWWVAW